MEHLAKQAAEIALRLAAFPADRSPADIQAIQALDAIEQLAFQIVKEVSALRVGKTYSVGESRGAWRAVTPPTRH